MATRVVLLIVGAVSTVAVARLLGPEGRGQYAIAFAIGAIGIQFGNLGLHAANTYFVARDESLLSGLLGNSLALALVAGSAGCAIAGATFLFFPAISPLSWPLLFIALALVPFGLAYLLQQNLLLGLNDIRHYNGIEVVARIFPLALIGSAALIGYSNATAFVLFGLGGVIAGFIWSLTVLVARCDERPYASIELFRRNLRYGFKAYVAAFCAFVVLRSDLLIVKYKLGLTETGLYSVAVALTEVIFAFPVAVGTVLFPRLTSMESDAERRSAASRVALLVGACMALVGVLAAAAAAPAVKIIFGTEYSGAAPAFVWLIPGIVLLSVNVILMNYFASIGMPMITVWSPAFAALVNVMLNLALVPRYGIVGASVSSSIAYTLMLGASLLYMGAKRDMQLVPDVGGGGQE